jgi:hypothetical protein
MKSNIARTVSIRMAALAILLLAPAVMHAASISLQASANVVTVGDLFVVDVMANELGLGAYDVTFQYSPLLVFIDSALVTFDTHLGAPDNSFAFTNQTLDTIEVAEVSFFTTASDLAALQTAPSYPLAHIQVKATQAGTAAFNFITTPYTAVSDYAGNETTGVAYQGISVLIQNAPDLPPAPPETGAAPEGSSAVLCLFGLALVTLSRVRCRRKMSVAAVIVRWRR